MYNFSPPSSASQTPVSTSFLEPTAGPNRYINYYDSFEAYAPLNADGSRMDIVEITQRTFDDPGSVGEVMGEPRTPDPWNDLILIGSRCPDDGCDYVSICQSNYTMFFSMATYWNCMTLAKISMLPYTGPSLLVNERFSGEVHEVLGLLNLEFNPDSKHPIQTESGYLDPLEVFRHVFFCADASCAHSPNPSSPCTWDKAAANVTSVDVENLTRWTHGLVNDVCSASAADIGRDTTNPDIVGPGVLISHLVQVILALIAWFICRLAFIRASHEFLYRTFAKGDEKLKYEKHYPRLGRILQRIEESRLAEATATFTFDFHEAQCFFLASLQLASLAATFVDIRLLGEFTFFTLDRLNLASQILNNLSLSVALLNQITFQRLQFGSVYTLILTTLVFALASTTRHWAFNRDSVGKLIHTARYSDIEIDECGNFQNLILHCHTSEETHYMPKGYTSQYYFIMVLLIILWLNKAGRELQQFHFVDKIEEVLQKIYASRALQLTTKLLSIFLFLSEAYLFSYAVISANSLVKYFSSGTTNEPIEGEDWNIGQVLSVLVWFPVLFKYIYVLIRGIEIGVGMRLLNRFVVRRGDRLNTKG